MGIHPSVYVVCTFAFAAVSGYVDDYSRVLGLEQLSRSGDPGKNVHDRQRSLVVPHGGCRIQRSKITSVNDWAGPEELNVHLDTFARVSSLILVVLSASSIASLLFPVEISSIHLVTCGLKVATVATAAVTATICSLYDIGDEAAAVATLSAMSMRGPLATGDSALRKELRQVIPS
ncbi:hypothetical protein PRIPAC_79275 [Pristionchus pacificus]|uniref:Uncharacterized protein n=1 Tax=Pristionchus pacificus TaxID=54126 RepID=A0A2A6BX81_PRIPA|nr:hypothetical protein PRIPAC_79275 [Pristionchus pacificus]|eukprot:PDM70499.1 hypothetical protein PRIPAC_46745 [Pristionchus pacificus]